MGISVTQINYDIYVLVLSLLWLRSL